MQIGSLFSGIGGFDLGLTSPVSWQVEKDKDCNRVLAHHFPETKRFNDVKEVGKANLTPVDLICGGFPCQDLSVAGKRAGLDGERSGLWFEFHRIIRELSPQWVLIENVPGLLSSNGGRDFAIILSGLVKLGYGAAWRVLDAQYFGVPQRRRRVFIVGSLGSGRCTEVLFEPSCGCGDTPPSRETGKEVAGCLGGGSTDSRRGWRGDLDTMGAYIAPTIRGGSPGGSTHGKPSGTDQGPFVCQKIADPLTSSFHKHGGASAGKDSMPHNLIAFGGNRTSGPTDKATACNAHGGTGRSDFESETFICFKPNQGAKSRSLGESHNLSVTLEGAAGGNNKPAISYNNLVRRLTPTEHLRLQGFPDKWLTLNPPLSDSAKYRMTGNAVAVPVIQWIGLKIRELSI